MNESDPYWIPVSYHDVLFNLNKNDSFYWNHNKKLNVLTLHPIQLYRILVSCVRVIADTEPDVTCMYLFEQRMFRVVAGIWCSPEVGGDILMVDGRLSIRSNSVVNQEFRQWLKDQQERRRTREKRRK